MKSPLRRMTRGGLPCLAAWSGLADAIAPDATWPSPRNLLILHNDEHNYRTFGVYRRLVPPEQASLWGTELAITGSIGTMRSNFKMPRRDRASKPATRGVNPPTMWRARTPSPLPPSFSPTARWPSFDRIGTSHSAACGRRGNRSAAVPVVAPAPGRPARAGIRRERRIWLVPVGRKPYLLGIGGPEPRLATSRI